MKKFIVTEEMELPGTDIMLEPGDEIFYPEEDDLLDADDGLLSGDEPMDEPIYEDSTDGGESISKADGKTKIKYLKASGLPADEKEKRKVKSDKEKLWRDKGYKVVWESDSTEKPSLQESSFERGLAYLQKGIELMLNTSAGRMPAVLAGRLYEAIHDQVASEYNEPRLKVFNKVVRKKAAQYLMDTPDFM